MGEECVGHMLVEERRKTDKVKCYSVWTVWGSVSMGSCVCSLGRLGMGEGGKVGGRR